MVSIDSSASSGNGSNAVAARLVSSCTGSLIANFTVHPLEVVKVRIQNSIESYSSATTATAATPPPAPRRRMIQPSSKTAALISGRRRHGATATKTTTSPFFQHHYQYRNQLLPSRSHGCGTVVLPPSAPPSSMTSSQMTRHPRSFSGPAANLYASSVRPSAVAALASSASKGPARPTNEIMQTASMIRNIATTEGVRGFYIGLRPCLVMIVPNTVVYYTIYDCFAAHFRQHQQQRGGRTAPTNSWVVPMVGGSVARLIASTVTAPLEYLKTVQAASSSSRAAAATTTTMTASGAGVAQASGDLAFAQSAGVWEPLVNLWRTEGVRSLYRGLEPLLWRDLPFSAIYWLCIERIREYKQQVFPNATTTQQVASDFASGAIAAALSALFTAPADVVKTRFQAHALRSAAATTTPENVTPFSILQDTIRTEGIGRLWRGNLARTLKVAPSCAIMVATYEAGKRTLLSNESF